MTNETFDSLATTITLCLVFLLPILVIPLSLVPAQDMKLFLLMFGTLISGLLWSIARLRGNSLTFPKSPLVVPLLTLPFVALISASFSGNFMHSFVGQGFALDTVLFVGVMSLAFGIGVFLFSSKDKVIKLYLTLAASALIFFIYHVAQLFLSGEFFPFDIFPGNTSNLIGKWNDVAIFSGFIATLSLVTLEMLRPRGLFKAVSFLNLVAALFMVAIVHFSMVWIALAAISALLFVRSFFESNLLPAHDARFSLSSDSASTRAGKVSGLPLLIFVISVFFIFAGPRIGNIIDSTFNTFQVEARPSWQSTFGMFKDVYGENALFGVGPNNFTKEWLLRKPTGTNQTPFWDVDFSFGVGIIPTFFITNGILSVLAWCTFFALFLFGGARLFLKRHEKLFDNYLATSSFLSAFFLWALSVFYVPHVTLFFLAFLFSGIFLTVETGARTVKAHTFVFNENPRTGFAAVAFLFVLVLLFALGLYASVEKFISGVYIQRTSTVIRATGDISSAKQNVRRAVIFSKSDVAYRASAEVSLLELAGLLNQGDNAENIRAQFQSALTAAIDDGKSAVSVDGKNYQNWILLGRIYETLVPFRVSGAYDNAKIAYEQARLLNPNNPRLVLNLARVEALNGNNKAARDYITEALRLKNDYTNAIFLLSQIEIDEGNVEEAIKSVEAATLLSPQDPLLFFQLGLLKYSEHEFLGSISSLERAVLLNSEYANARYFLGLSYYEVGRIQDAIREFNAVKNLDPGNSEVNGIIENLIAGRGPLENFTPPFNPLEKRGLPIEE